MENGKHFNSNAYYNNSFEQTKNNKNKKHHYRIADPKKFAKRILQLIATGSLLTAGGVHVYNNRDDLGNLGSRTKAEIANVINEQTLNPKENEITYKIESTPISGLDNAKLNLKDWEEISKTGGQVQLKENGSVRSTNKFDYRDKRPDEITIGKEKRPGHSAIFEANEDVTFEAKGNVYKDKDGNLAMSIDEFEQTADGDKLGLNKEVDKDGMVVIHYDDAEFTPNQDK